MFVRRVIDMHSKIAKECHSMSAAIEGSRFSFYGIEDFMRSSRLHKTLEFSGKSL